MSIPAIVLGDSGSGKSTSLRNLDPANTLLIQTVKKPLPFKKQGWGYFSKEAAQKGGSAKAGNIFVTDQSDAIINLMQRTSRKVIVIDDWNLLMTNQFMRRSHEVGFQKFSDIGRSAWDVLMAASALPDDVRVYLLGHLSTDEMGHMRAKTIGKMIDEKCPVESLFTIVLRAVVSDGAYEFVTQSNGLDTCKSPMGLFPATRIENDLAEVDRAICEYYDLVGAPTNHA